MIRSLGATVVVLAALGVPSSAARAEQGSLTFPLELEDPLAGRPIRIEAERAVHLVFFATWCPPCLEELPRLGDLEERWRDRGYRLVLIAVPTRQSRERVAQLVEHRRPPGRVVFDADGAVSAACEITDLPTHLVVDGSGRIVHRAPALDADVESALAGLLAAGRDDR